MDAVKPSKKNLSVIGGVLVDLGEDYWGDDKNPYQHNPGDTLVHITLDYWDEQIKATIAMAAQLAVQVTNIEDV